MYLTLHYIFSIRMNQLLLLGFAAFILTGVSEYTGDRFSPSIWLLPILFLLFISDHAIASVQRNEFLRSNPTLNRRVIFTSNTLIVIILTATAYFGGFKSLVIILSMIFWGLCNLIKTMLPPKMHPMPDGLKATPFLCIAFDMDIDFQLNALWSSVLFILSTTAFLFFQSITQKWHPSIQYIDNFILGERKEGHTKSQTWNLKKIKKAHSIELYQPLFSFTLFITLFFIGSIIVNSFHAHLNNFNPFTFILLGIFLTAALSGITFSDRRNHVGWYALRPGKGNLNLVLLDLFFQSAKQIALFCTVSFTLSCLFQAIVFDLTTRYILSNLALCVLFFSFSLGTQALLASLRVTGWPITSLVGIAGGTLWILLLVITVVFLESPKVSWLSLPYALSLFVICLVITVYRLRRTNWI